MFLQCVYEFARGIFSHENNECLYTKHLEQISDINVCLLLKRAIIAYAQSRPEYGLFIMPFL